MHGFEKVFEQTLAQNSKLIDQVAQLTQEVANLREQIAYMNRKRFGVSSEQNVDGQ